MVGNGVETRKPLAVTLAKGLGALEMEILDIIWAMGRATSRDVFEKMRDRRRLGQSTVLTVLRRLSGRGILEREVANGVYVYVPAISREELGMQMIDNVINLIFRGSVESALEHLARKRQV